MGTRSLGATGTRSHGNTESGRRGGHGELLVPAEHRGPVPRTQNSDFSIILTLYVSQTGRFTPKNRVFYQLISPFTTPLVEHKEI
jgi:hypothetical protein